MAAICEAHRLTKKRNNFIQRSHKQSQLQQQQQQQQHAPAGDGARSSSLATASQSSPPGDSSQLGDDEESNSADELSVGEEEEERDRLNEPAMPGGRRVQAKPTLATAAAAQTPSARMQSHMAEMHQRFGYLLKPSSSQRGAEGGGAPLADSLGSRFDADLQRLQWTWMRSQMGDVDGDADADEQADKHSTAIGLTLMSLPPDPLQSGRRAEQSQHQPQPPDGPPVDHGDCDLITFTLDGGSECSEQTGTTGSPPQPSARGHDQHRYPAPSNSRAEKTAVAHVHADAPEPMELC